MRQRLQALSLRSMTKRTPENAPKSVLFSQREQSTPSAVELLKTEWRKMDKRVKVDFETKMVFLTMEGKGSQSWILNEIIS
ncbi:hypothetical protein RRG08_066781 [Elysia crispata]|uniref:Uncharacterized protein n=1 Tax=Elysia crispata TaxID=231223 RepID=A0AAE0XPT7_9GAST|nr:hypothetical protein RRG08_066781 [Elysia crispata]